MLTLEQVIQAVRDKHPAFSEEDIPNGSLARYLSDCQRRLVSKALEENRYFLLREKVFDLPFALYDEGEKMPPFDHVLPSCTVRVPGVGEYPLLVTTYEDRFTPRRWPAAYVTPERFFLLGAESEWPNGTEILVKYSPIIPDLEALGDTFTVPDKAKGALVAAGALFCARRMGLAAEFIEPFVGDARDEEKTFLAGVGHMVHPGPIQG